MVTFAERVIAFNQALEFNGDLPDGVRIMNPFRENPWALPASSAFYRKYYSDDRERTLILGINPGRFGAGLTGVPFTDPKRLREVCGIADYQGPDAHEPSSVFIYAMIDKYGGPDKFYGDFYINSICPLGFVAEKSKGREVNHNYYDSPELKRDAADFILTTLRLQLDFGLNRRVCFCLGRDKNYKYINDLNNQHGFFQKVVPLDHPRFVMQYKNKSLDQYVGKYLDAFAQAG